MGVKQTGQCLFIFLSDHKSFQAKKKNKAKTVFLKHPCNFFSCKIHFCKIQLFFILSSVLSRLVHIHTLQQKPRYTEFKISHNYITRVSLNSAQITLHMNGCFSSTRLISGGSELHMKVINGVSFLKSTLHRPE